MVPLNNRLKNHKRVNHIEPQCNKLSLCCTNSTLSKQGSYSVQCILIWKYPSPCRSFFSAITPSRDTRSTGSYIPWNQIHQGRYSTGNWIIILYGFPIQGSVVVKPFKGRNGGKCSIPNRFWNGGQCQWIYGKIWSRRIKKRIGSWDHWGSIGKDTFNYGIINSPKARV